MDYGLWDVAPTAAAVLKFDFNTPDGRPIQEVLEHLRDVRRLAILIIDSLGYDTFRHIERYVPVLDGMVMPLKADSRHTTPAIATILLGVKGQTHLIMDETDIYDSSMDTVLETAERQGFRAALIIEKRGADAMYGRIDTVVGVEDDQDIHRYDAAIIKGLIASMQGGCSLSVAHLRALDRCAHEGQDIAAAARSINDDLKLLIKALPGTALLVVGDHPLHIRGNHDEHVALIAMSI